MKTPEELNKEFSEWKTKKGEKLLKLYQEKSSQESRGEDSSVISKKIFVMEKEISQRKAYLEKKLSRIYERMYKSGASTEAKKRRQERTHHLCNLGGLIEKAGLGEMEPAALLGMMLQQVEYMATNPTIVSRWKERGQMALQGTPSEPF